MSMNAAPIAIISPGRAERSPRRRCLWPLMVFALLGLNATIVGVTIYFAASDKSGAIEPDYYAKALRYEDAIRLREASRALGWRADAVLRAGADPTAIELAVTLTDRDGRAIEGAAARAILFASIRSGSRESLALRPDPRAPGVYAAPARIDRSGLWRIRLTIERSGDTFYQESDLIIP